MSANGVVRPEHIASANGAPFKLDLTADVTEHLGGSSYIYAHNHGGETLVVEQRGYCTTKPGEQVSFTFDPGQAYLFGSDGMRIR